MIGVMRANEQNGKPITRTFELRLKVAETKFDDTAYVDHAREIRWRRMGADPAVPIRPGISIPNLIASFLHQTYPWRRPIAADLHQEPSLF
jgi:hypothetical protein